MVNHQGNESPEEALILNIKLEDDEFGSFEEREAALVLEDELEELLSEVEGAEYDGHEFGSGWCKLYIYGSDARRMAEALLPMLRSRSLPAGSSLVQRFGPPGAPQERIRL